ncbi:ethanolamine utilization protein [Desulfitobacterium dehalogenans ATCC 51507]|uniref:Ethanolamine utilization protein n=1 Tax=Desulfitobacterium dehalogenans (strain ATCC 51507 / DSM 9161 / JW/IU-DC1) TaxID=756499 RepID=I4AES0_DESDJ|nr:EutP/PduV family microcompartment system protein [Desulfitobacterium dehalogenans]AFM02455.1 ethanolamine utilization protein [Desulfitobacterium dehalogenans ATCC 51507]
MKKRIMIVGPTQAGKSSLANILNDTSRPLKKTQDVIYGRNTIDTPGSYIENPSMYKYLIATAQTASHVLLLIDSSRPVEVYPPGFAKTFTCPVIGVMTKIDLEPENAPLCTQQMQSIGVSGPYFRISLTDNTGVGELKEHLLGTSN